MCTGLDMPAKRMIASEIDAFAAKAVAEIKCTWPVGRDESQCANTPTMCGTCAEEMARLDSSSAIQIANESVEQRIAKAVAAELGELEKRAVEDRDTWSSLKLYDKANAVDAIVVAIRVRIGRARGKDVENENA